MFADAITLRYAGEPRGKGRPRSRIASTRNGRKFISVYTDAETRKFESALRAVAFDVMRGRAPLHGPLRVQITARFSVPESWSKKRKYDALVGLVMPTGKPDADNIFKCVDAFNGIVWTDDSQIVKVEITKVYSDKPSLEVTARPLSAPLFENTERPVDELESPAEPEPESLSYAGGSGSICVDGASSE